MYNNPKTMQNDGTEITEQHPSPGTFPSSNSFDAAGSRQVDLDDNSINVFRDVKALFSPIESGNAAGMLKTGMAVLAAVATSGLKYGSWLLSPESNTCLAKLDPEIVGPGPEFRLDLRNMEASTSVSQDAEQSETHEAVRPLRKRSVANYEDSQAKRPRRRRQQQHQGTEASPSPEASAPERPNRRSGKRAAAPQREPELSPAEVMLKKFAEVNRESFEESLTAVKRIKKPPVCKLNRQQQEELEARVAKELGPSSPEFTQAIYNLTYAMGEYDNSLAVLAAAESFANLRSACVYAAFHHASLALYDFYNKTGWPKGLGPRTSPRIEKPRPSETYPDEALHMRCWRQRVLKIVDKFNSFVKWAVSGGKLPLSKVVMSGEFLAHLAALVGPGVLIYQNGSEFSHRAFQRMGKHEQVKLLSQLKDNAEPKETARRALGSPDVLKLLSPLWGRFPGKDIPLEQFLERVSRMSLPRPKNQKPKTALPSSNDNVDNSRSDNMEPSSHDADSSYEQDEVEEENDTYENKSDEESESNAANESESNTATESEYSVNDDIEGPSAAS
ncbi:uncharacterized protein SPPG_07651 [Spizellomyces punctatus DAOM BR117]|uniref:Uncharacterized protein n=1 Tax=Spizellomyces punctatus (strain DAOM BR117) TaxID=645134 RepID=A0A0L0H7R4_SPIPD|nr:uncharacterized protein SPPG_07651 [Spizellomyces punctatus DAOM BR117]KNC97262.1 hypothetical protein SPPG_07651 [Spizellomyces punctatus DAOM BR117]|eukprot:XP_016605302.1 hypothetical protein SPPG_07651 [Spizellomyces punctatus DAOM BR117]